MHQVQVVIEKTPAEPLHHVHKKVLKEGVQESTENKWLWVGFAAIRWGSRLILLHAWASYLHDRFKLLAYSWPTLSASFTLFSLLLYACFLFYLRFARHALASLSLNKSLALLNLLWASALLLTGLVSTYLAQQFAAAEATGVLSVLFYPHAVVAYLFIHLLAHPLPPRERLSRPSEAQDPPPKRASCSTVCSLCVQILFMALWILYPIARILDSHYLKSPYVLTLFILGTLASTVCFIVFFCSAVALVFLEHREVPTIL